MKNIKLFNRPGIILAGCLLGAINFAFGQSKIDYTNYIKGKSTPEWEDMLINRKGWIGADGIYAVALNGVETPGKAANTETFFWFSDSIIGEIQNDSLKTGWFEINNTVAYLKGDKPDKDNFKFYYPVDAAGNPKSVFEPKSRLSTKDDFFWLGDGVFNHAKDSTIYIFANRIRLLPAGVMPFEQKGVTLIALPKGSRPPFANHRQIDAPLYFQNNQGPGDISYGACVMPNTVGSGAPKPDGYIYVYGVRGHKKELVVARVKDVDFENFSKWRYWDGAAWGTDPLKSAKVTERVSHEMSVSFMEDGRIMAVYQLDTNSPEIVVQVGDTPAGPFYPYKKVWETPQVYEDIDFYTYNAKAYPHLSKPGELLISYNMNTFNFREKMHKHPFHLRPRFITVKYK